MAWWQPCRLQALIKRLHRLAVAAAVHSPPFITGPFGRLMAIIAVIGLGFLAFAGRLSWFTAGAVVIGIGLVFGAPAIVDQMISSVGGG